MELQYSAEEVATSLLTRVISNMESLDGYGPAQSVLEATYRNEYLRTLQAGKTIPRPLVLSLDKVKPLHMKDGLPALHHPENIVLTRLCINWVKGKDGPSILPWLKRLLQLAKVAKLQPVTANYLPEQLQEMVTFERFADNATMIRRTFAHSNVLRLRDGLAPGYQKTFDEIIAPQFKSGIFCGFVIRGPYKPVELRTSELPDITVNGVHFQYWTEDEREELVEDFRQMEQDTKRFNPHGLTIPRNEYGSPNLWRECNGADWEFVWREVVRKLRITDTECDAQNDTEESPASYLVEFAVQWLETGGKCHVFGFRLVADMSHFQSYSIGRARFRYDDQRQIVGEVQAAEKMQSGCTTLRPTDMSRDYRHSRRTLVVESLKANSLWSFFLNDASTRAKIEGAIEGIPESSAWFDARKSLEEYPYIPPPSS